MNKAVRRMFLPRDTLQWHLVMCLAGIFFFLLMGMSDTSAEDGQEVAQKQAELKELKKRIDALQASLQQNQARLLDEDAVLRDVDLRINAINVRLRELDNDKQEAERDMRSLLQKQRSTATELAREQQILAQHLRSAYISGNEEYVKLLLNLQDPATISRILAYYRFLTRDRVETISRINDYLQELQSLEDSIALRSQQLDTLIRQQQARWKSLELAYTEQKKAIAGLRSRIHESNEEVQRLRSDEAALLGLIEKLQMVLNELLEEEKHTDLFREYRGRLSLPVKARIAATFGSKRSIGNMRWNGILLRADEGSPIRAIYNGRVVYAEWMRGFGLLLIIDHGDGYMSLYGHNESLLVEEGDWIETGQPVATVGTSGGGSKPGLYFEIRYRGKPQDPLRWCKR